MTLAIPTPVRRWVRRVARRVHSPAYILGRVACLGQDVFNAMGVPIRPRHHALLNMQKVRCDVINEWVAAGGRGAGGRTRAEAVVGHLARKDVTWLIQQQERMIWFEHTGPVTCAVMDTFAELTDQRFRHRREGWSFACHYTDLNHTAAFEAEFACEGLLAVERIAGEYAAFCRWFGGRHPGVRLYMIEFSAALDSREVFRERGESIHAALQGLGQEFPFVRVLGLPADQIEKATGDEFAYHFSRATVERFAGEWRARLQMEGDHGR